VGTRGVAVWWIGAGQQTECAQQCGGEM
jgi:hypothetical protein